MKTTSELRKNLSECFILAKEGKLTGDALRGVIGCANQISMSISVETKARAQSLREGIALKAMGEMEI